MNTDAEVTTEGLAELFWLYPDHLACCECGKPPRYHLPTGGIFMHEGKVVASVSKFYCYTCAELEIARQNELRT